MLYVRKVQRVNKSSTIVIPPALTKWLEVQKGNYIMIRRVTGDRRNGILVEKLDTKIIEGEMKDDGK